MTFNDNKLITAAQDWFQSTLSDIERESKTMKDGTERNEAGQHMEKNRLEIKYFGITLKEFKDKCLIKMN